MKPLLPFREPYPPGEKDCNCRFTLFLYRTSKHVDVSEKEEANGLRFFIMVMFTGILAYIDKYEIMFVQKKK